MGTSAIGKSGGNPTSFKDSENHAAHGNSYLSNDVHDELPIYYGDGSDDSQSLVVALTDAMPIHSAFETWADLWAFTRSLGSSRFTRDQYDTVRRLLNTISSHVTGREPFCLPSSKTIQRLKSKNGNTTPLIPISSALICHSTIRECHRLNSDPSQSTFGRTDQESFDLILPSSYAKSDIMESSFFNHLIATSYNARDVRKLRAFNLPLVEPRPYIDTVPLVRARQLYYGPTQSISFDTNKSEVMTRVSEPDDLIQVMLAIRKPLIDVVRKLYTSAAPANHGSSVTGRISIVFDVLHEQLSRTRQHPVKSNSIINRLPWAHRFCIDLFGFAPSTGKEFTDERPLIVPSDTVCLLSPEAGIPSPSNEYVYVIVLVFRFRTALQVPPRFCFLLRIPQTQSELKASYSLQAVVSSSKFVFTAITTIELLAIHNRKRGPSAFQPVSSIGRLANNETYAIYRVLLFWDGFQPFSTMNRSTIGIYMACLNMCTEGLRKSHVRTLAVTEQGTNYNDALLAIIEDLTDMSVNGIVCRDPFGNLIRLFAYLVGIIGDTPALNNAHDTKGRAASAGCHLCNYHRKKGGEGSLRHFHTAVHSQRTNT